MFPSWASFHSFMASRPQIASLKRPQRPPVDLGYAANKWECSFIGQSVLQRLFFEKKLSENRLFVFPLISLQPYLHTHINYIDAVLLLFFLVISLLLLLYAFVLHFSLSHAIFQLYCILKVWLFLCLYRIIFFISFSFILLAVSICLYWLPQLTWQSSCVYVWVKLIWNFLFYHYINQCSTVQSFKAVVGSYCSKINQIQFHLKTRRCVNTTFPDAAGLLDFLTAVQQCKKTD